MTNKKHGGKRPGAGPPKKAIIKKTYSVVIYETEAEKLKKMYGTLSKALVHLANSSIF